MTRPTRVAVIYYSATGNIHRLAHALAEGAAAEGSEVRVRHVEELASELLISQNQDSRPRGAGGRMVRGRSVRRLARDR
jgi:NAD(P)H dehydrogenase (quinone)